MKNRDINQRFYLKVSGFFFLLAFLFTGVQDLFAQGYDTNPATFDDPDRRVVLNNSSDRIKTITQIVYIVNDGSPNGVRFIYQDNSLLNNTTDNPPQGGGATPFMDGSGGGNSIAIGNSEQVRIYRIRVDSTGSGDFADIYPIDRQPVSTTNFGDDMADGTTPSDQATIVRTGNSTQLPYDFNAGGTTPVQDYIDELINVVSIADMRSYWDLDTGSLGPAGEDFDDTGSNVAPERFVDIMYDELFCCFDFIAVSERWGNTPMALAALDENGEILRRNSPGSAFEGDPNEDDKSFRVDFAGADQGDLYQWNTGIQNGFGDDSGDQPQWLSVFQVRQFYGGGLDDIPEGESTADHEGPGGTGSIVDLNSEPPIPVFGYRVYMLSPSGNGGDGKILALESPRITFTEQECFRTLSSPFEGLTYAQVLEEVWTQGSDNADFEGGDANVFTFDVNATSDEPGFAAGTGDYAPVPDLDTIIPPGEGFLVSIFTDDVFGVPGSWDKALDRVRGKEHGDGPADVVNPTVNQTPDGFTLVGNPYVSSIDFDLLTKNGLTDVAYIYDNAAGDWVSYSQSTQLGFTDNDGLISPFQGFFVQTATSFSGTASIEFNDDAKVPDENGTFYGKQNSSPEVDFVRLELEGEDLKTSAWVAFTEEGSIEGYTYGDALQLEPYAGDFAVLASQKLDESLLDIGVFPHPSEKTGDIEIPLYIQTTQTGEFTLRATDLNLPLSMEGLVLYDRERDVEIPITGDMEYTFQLNRAKKAKLADFDSNSCQLAGNDLAMAGTPHKAKVSNTGTTRFMIKLADQRGPDGEMPVFVKLNQNFPNPFNPVTQISYELPQQSDVLLEVYDMTGRQIATLVNETVPAGSHQVSFDASDLSSGVYLYRLTAGNQVFSRKLTVIK